MTTVEFKANEVPGWDIVCWLMDTLPKDVWKNLTPACVENTGIIFYRDEDAIAFKLKFNL